ncbi:alpha/beta hydrolase [Streptomyces sp. NPDC050636]|uniref:alpha/beta fold hydrolase n=1 Tax=Streptomyces sp. NPDC050636 TaxID=3154510 RepID=UPI003428C8AC
MRASMYLGNLGGLSRQRKLLMLDLRGTGDSGAPADSATYRCDRQVADVEALRRHLGAEQTNARATEIYASSGAFEPAATRAAIAALIAPVLILAGELDSGSGPGIATAIAKLFPHAELTVQPGGGHSPWLDAPLYFVQTVGAFLALERDGESI